MGDRHPSESPDRLTPCERGGQSRVPTVLNLCHEFHSLRLSGELDIDGFLYELRLHRRRDLAQNFVRLIAYIGQKFV